MKQAEKKLSTTTPKFSTPRKDVVLPGFTVQTGTKAGTEGVIDAPSNGEEIECHALMWRIENDTCCLKCTIGQIG